MESPDTTSLSVRLRHDVVVLHHQLDRSAAALAAGVTPAAIHKTRVAARRLRVLLRAYRGEFDSKQGKRYRRILKRLTRDLEAAREADVTRRTIRGLAKDGKGYVNGHSRPLYERAVASYESAVYGLRLTMASAAWQRRLGDLRELSELSSLVKANEDSAVRAMHRVLKRRRRRLHDALERAGRSPKRLHRVRLKIKTMRYLLENGLSKSAIARDAELKRLRQLQNCLGDMHDEENLLKALRAERPHREAARDICTQLEARKNRYYHAFKRQRKSLMHLWNGAA